MDELISRKAAIDALDAIHYTDREDWWAVLSTVENLPPVQPEHGEWKYHSNPTIGINPETAYCSCCGFRVDTTGNIDFDEYNFCPHCGAKMER